MIAAIEAHIRDAVRYGYDCARFEEKPSEAEIQSFIRTLREAIEKWPK